MRLDSRSGDRDYVCYDAKQCCVVKGVVWVDSETARWARYDMSAAGIARAHATGHLTQIEQQEQRISIYIDRRLVVFNEVDDNSGDKEPVSVDRPIPVGVPQ
jgi:hypothetical protein